MKKFKFLFVLLLSVLLMACAGEDGTDGNNGVNGVEGAVG